MSRSTLLPLTFGVSFADLDLDGNLDLLLANGHIEPEIANVQQEISFRQPPQLFLGNGEGSFADGSALVGETFAEPVVGRGLATADFDRDGDLDVLLTVNGGAPRLFRNDLPPGARWIRIRLVGSPPNRDAVGAVVTMHAGGRAQRRHVRTGGSYLSQSETNPLVFGLGEAHRADSVTVRWPTTGVVQTIGPLEAGEARTVTEEAES